MAVLGASGWDAQLFASADRGAVFAIVEAMLGGDGSQPAHAAERALSKVEADVAGLFFASIARALRRVLCADRAQHLRRRGDGGQDRLRQHRACSMRWSSPNTASMCWSAAARC